jgi:hypothetical protein
MAALDDCPRPGKEPTITAEAKAWLVSLWPAARPRRGRVPKMTIEEDPAGAWSCILWALWPSSSAA